VTDVTPAPATAATTAPPPSGSPSDAARALRDEVEALHAASFGWAMSLCGRDRALADDVLQVAYEVVLAGRARWDVRSSFRTWLFGVIRMTALRERRRRWLGAITGLGAAPEPRARDSLAPEAVAALSESARRVRDALGVLPARQRQVVHLVFYEGLTIAQAAQVMGVSLGSARQHYERGKARLVIELEGASP
jgi:RNA polymerase sigma-70 factor (ECF subfamily)